MSISNENEHKREVLRRLRREIRMARLKMTLDERQGRVTSEAVKILASLRTH